MAKTKEPKPIEFTRKDPDGGILVLRPEKSEQVRFVVAHKGVCHSRFRLDLFDHWVHIITIDEKEAPNTAEFEELVGMTFPEPSGTAGALVFKLAHGVFGALLRSDAPDHWIVHECYHLVFAVCDNIRNTVITKNNQEFGAYLIELIYQNVKELQELHLAKLKELKDKKEEIK